MFLNGLTVTDYASASDSELDQMYADSYANMQAATGQSKLDFSLDVNDIAQEILSREGTAGGFLVALFGSRFPKYDAIQKQTGGFVAHDQAVSSVEESAGNVATNLEAGAKMVLSTGSMIGLGLLALAGLWFFGRK
ncbi:MAG TPA: hypothetical protein VIY48_13805 [Candidatus Paceibacterota bacterium]